MVISKVEASCLKVPIKTPYSGEPRNVGMVLVRIDTDEGITGYGIARDLERFPPWPQDKVRRSAPAAPFPSCQH